MDLEELKKLHHFYQNNSFNINDAEAMAKYEEYRDAGDANDEFKKWSIEQFITEAGLNSSDYCCLDMGCQMTQDKMEKEKLKDDPKYINYDAVITYNKSHEEYGLPIHDGGSSYIPINLPLVWH
jgi:hypothetical protein